MRRVAEVMYIVESEREEFLKGALNPDVETRKVLWVCGVRNQQYFDLNGLIFMTFEYKGNDFRTDMAKMATYLDGKGLLVRSRRRDVPSEDRTSTNWWAPVKKLGAIMETSPFKRDEEASDVELGMIGDIAAGNYSDIAYDEDDWSESIHY